MYWRWLSPSAGVEILDVSGFFITCVLLVVQWIVFKVFSRSFSSILRSMDLWSFSDPFSRYLQLAGFRAVSKNCNRANCFNSHQSILTLPTTIWFIVYTFDIYLIKYIFVYQYTIQNAWEIRPREGGELWGCMLPCPSYHQDIDTDFDFRWRSSSR